MPRSTPFLKTVTLPNANQNYQLSALINALDADECSSSLTSRAQYLQIQFDQAAGADVLMIGNSDLGASNWGVLLVGTQAWTVHSMGGNLIRLDQVYLRSNGAGHVCYVAYLPR